MRILFLDTKELNRKMYMETVLSGKEAGKRMRPISSVGQKEKKMFKSSNGKTL